MKIFSLQSKTNLAAWCVFLGLIAALSSGFTSTNDFISSFILSALLALAVLSAVRYFKYKKGIRIFSLQSQKHVVGWSLALGTFANTFLALFLINPFFVALMTNGYLQEKTFYSWKHFFTGEFLFVAAIFLMFSAIRFLKNKILKPRT